jgi:OOP family OmpA-OmpF porin
LKELLSSLNSYGSLLVKLVITIGIVVVFSYCAFSINFFPKGLTLGDSLVFIFIALGFGIFYIFWLALGYLTLYGLFYPFTLKLGKNDDLGSKVLMFIVGLIFFGFLLLFYFSTNDFRSVIAPLASGLIILIATFFWNTQPEGLNPEELEKRERARVGIILIAFFIAPLIGMTAVSQIIDSSFRVFGINQKNVSLVLSESNYKIVNGTAKGLDIPIFGCELEKETTRIVHNVNMLWHGIGDKSLIVLLSPDNNKFKPVARLELESAGTNVLKVLDNNASFNACINLESDTLFESYSSEPSPLGKINLDMFIDKIKAYLKGSNLEITSASITGYTDRIPVANDSDTNYALSLRRANSVFTMLKPLFNKSVSKKVNVSGKGALNPKSMCSQHQDSLELTECLSVDRRVELVFQFKRIKTNGLLKKN